jgi:hypothetical protein
VENPGQRRQTMREAILLLAVFALMALSAKANGAEALRAPGKGERPVAVGTVEATPSVVASDFR